ncbi:unnamed protein product, partial [Ectocarpus fasciculatus]
MLCLPSMQRSGCRALQSQNWFPEQRTHEHELKKLSRNARGTPSFLGRRAEGPQAHARARLLAHAKREDSGPSPGPGSRWRWRCASMPAGPRSFTGERLSGERERRCGRPRWERARLFPDGVLASPLPAGPTRVLFVFPYVRPARGWWGWARQGQARPGLTTGECPGLTTGPVSAYEIRIDSPHFWVGPRRGDIHW